MRLTTPVSIPIPPRRIDYQDRILSLGSCFADHIAAKLQEAYFRVAANPFGTLYNPLSIANALRLQAVPDLVEWGGLYHSLYHHGVFSSPSRQEAEEAIRQSISCLQTAWADASVVLITFGTAWVYEWAASDSPFVVGNCHKMPADRFRRRRLTADEIVSAWLPLLQTAANQPLTKPRLILFTVSPIRHIKDGLHENQLSKAILLQAVDRLIEQATDLFGPDAPLRLAYFPSYEIMLDELRDYRFYAPDMLHPSETAVDYIWERFSETFFSDETHREMQPLEALYRDRHHRLLHPDSPEAQRFRDRVERQADALRVRYPWI